MRSRNAPFHGEPDIRHGHFSVMNQFRVIGLSAQDREPDGCALLGATTLPTVSLSILRRLRCGRASTAFTVDRKVLHRQVDIQPSFAHSGNQHKNEC